jgi:hypothetical protein
MKKRLFLLVLPFLIACSVREFGYKNFKIGNINLIAEYYGYGKDSKGNEDITAKWI